MAGSQQLLDFLDFLDFAIEFADPGENGRSFSGAKRIAEFTKSFSIDVDVVHFGSHRGCSRAQGLGEG